MPTFAKNARGKKDARKHLPFPDRAAFDTVEEYDKRVKEYWGIIDTYRDIAMEFHGEIMNWGTPGRKKRRKRVKRETQRK